MPFLNFTTSLGTSNSVFYNTSYIIASQPPGMTTPTVWMFFISVGIIALLLSRISTEPTAKDLSGIIAVPILLISSIQAFAVDVAKEPLYIPNVSSTNIGYVIQTHEIYHYDLIGVVLGILFLISIANLYLLWLESKRVIPEEQPIVDLSMRSNPRKRKEYKENRDDEE